MTMRNLLSLCALLALSACAIIIVPEGDKAQRPGVLRGNGETASELRPVPALAMLSVGGPVHLEVRVGQAPSLRIDADSNLMSLIHTDTIGDQSGATTLRISVDSQAAPRNPIHIIYTVPQLRHIGANDSASVAVSGLGGAPLHILADGSARLRLTGRVGQLDLRLHDQASIDAPALFSDSASISADGSARVALGPVQGATLNIHQRDAATVQVRGSVQGLNVRVNGSGNLNLSGLTARDASVNHHGTGTVDVTVSHAITARNTGAGQLTLNGNPAFQNINTRVTSVVQ